jgi:hypothetical protein
MTLVTPLLSIAVSVLCTYINTFHYLYLSVINGLQPGVLLAAAPLPRMVIPREGRG